MASSTSSTSSTSSISNRNPIPLVPMGEASRNDSKEETLLTGLRLHYADALNIDFSNVQKIDVLFESAEVLISIENEELRTIPMYWDDHKNIERLYKLRLEQDPGLEAPKYFRGDRAPYTDVREPLSVLSELDPTFKNPEFRKVNHYLQHFGEVFFSQLKTEKEKEELRLILHAAEIIFHACKTHFKNHLSEIEEKRPYFQDKVAGPNPDIAAQHILQSLDSQKQKTAPILEKILNCNHLAIQIMLCLRFVARRQPEAVEEIKIQVVDLLRALKDPESGLPKNSQVYPGFSINEELFINTIFDSLFCSDRLKYTQELNQSDRTATGCFEEDFFVRIVEPLDSRIDTGLWPEYRSAYKRAIKGSACEASSEEYIFRKLFNELRILINTALESPAEVELITSTDGLYETKRLGYPPVSSSPVFSELLAEAKYSTIQKVVRSLLPDGKNEPLLEREEEEEDREDAVIERLLLNLRRRSEERQERPAANSAASPAAPNGLYSDSEEEESDRETLFSIGEGEEELIAENPGASSSSFSEDLASPFLAPSIREPGLEPGFSFYAIDPGFCSAKAYTVADFLENCRSFIVMTYKAKGLERMDNKNIEHLVLMLYLQDIIQKGSVQFIRNFLHNIGSEEAGPAKLKLTEENFASIETLIEKISNANLFAARLILCFRFAKRRINGKPERLYFLNKLLGDEQRDKLIQTLQLYKRSKGGPPSQKYSTLALSDEPFIDRVCSEDERLDNLTLEEEFFVRMIEGALEDPIYRLSSDFSQEGLLNDILEKCGKLFSSAFREYLFGFLLVEANSLLSIVLDTPTPLNDKRKYYHYLLSPEYATTRLGLPSTSKKGFSGVLEDQLSMLPTIRSALRE